jgi:hypothetical protein
LIEEDPRESIPYNNSIDLLQTEVDNNAVDVMKDEKIVVHVVSKKALQSDIATNVAFKYLFWACYRSYIYVAHHVVSAFGISPFLSYSDDLRSPFMVAIEHNQFPIVKMLLSKTYHYPTDPKLIER